MALSSAAFGSRASAACLAWVLGIVGSSAACAGETNGKTEVLVSIDAIGDAKLSTSVRIQVNAAVVELERTKDWPFEVLVSASDSSDATFQMRVFGLRNSMVMGGAKKDGTFRKGRRTGLDLELDPSADIGSLPEVNAQVGPGKVVIQPDDMPDPERDGAAGAMDSGASLDASGDGSGDPADGGPDTCEPGEACGDAATLADACVPSATDCGGCGKTCAIDRQCLSEQCVPIPLSNCTAPMSIDGRLYRYCSDMRSWDSARAACREMGYDLVIFNSSDEYEKVKAKFPAATVDSWLGGHDRGDNGTGASACKKTMAEGVWRWVNPQTGSEQGAEFCRFATSNSTSCTASPNAFLAWVSGQPDNSGCSCGVLNLGACSNGEDCLAMGTNGWSDSECTDARTYLCEEY